MGNHKKMALSTAPAGLYRAASAPKPLERATSMNTLNNIGDLKGWVAVQATKWVSGVAITPAEMSEGHALVYKICTESSQPKDAENQCYTLYLDYCRGICGEFGEGKERRTAFQALKAIFKYLDQHFTGSKDRPGMVRSKQPTSKLCAGQNLSSSAREIAADANWIPDYQAAPAPASAAAAPVQPAAQLPLSVVSRHSDFLNQPLYGDANNSVNRCTIYGDFAQLLDKFGVAGLSIGTLHNGVVGSTCSGLAQREDPYNACTSARSLPMQADTWVQVASLSKTVATAFAMEYLGERGINFDTNVNQLLAKIGSNYRLQPADRAPASWANEVQLRHLVNHTGLGMHYVYGFPPDRMRGMPPMQDLMEGKHNYESIFVSKKPNTKFAYSGGGFVMLQHICQTIAGSEQAFVEATRKFMDKCGMANEFSFVQETEAQQADAGGTFDMAAGYSDEGARVHSTGRLMFPGFAAGGHGTPRALARFLGHLAKAYKSASGSGAISHSTAVSMLDQTSDCGARDFMNSLIGLGVFVATAGPNKFMIHQCANDGFRGLYMVCYDGPGAARGPNGFVLISNGDNGAVPLNCEVTKQLLQDYAEFDSGFDWDCVAGREYNVEGVAQEQIVNAGLKGLVFDAMIDPNCGSKADSPVIAAPRRAAPHGLPRVPS